MRAQDQYWTQAVEDALTVPAVANSYESDSWITRNLAELLLFMEVFDGPVDRVDDAVQLAAPQQASSRFARRLRGMRERRGPVPPFYPAGLSNAPQYADLSGHELDRVLTYCDLADLLYDGLQTESQESHSALGGIGERAYEARRSWRPTYRPNMSVEFVEIPDLSPELVWRAWTLSPVGIPTMVVLDESLTSPQIDIWWGVHNGAHLDHLSYSTVGRPAKIEFGSGLLLAESLVMAVELMAGLEATDRNTRKAVWDGLVERAGRLPLPVARLPADRPSYNEAQRQSSDEFNPLPTLAMAYVGGVLDLVGNKFSHELVPSSMSLALTARWTALLQQESRIPRELATQYDV